MNLVDSSGWLEYFTSEPNAEFFAPAIEDTSQLIISPINLFEVFKVILREKGEGEALIVIAAMQQGKLVEFDTTIALSAAKLSLELKIPMADSIILATARNYNAILWTQDSDFENIPGVKFVKKKGK